MIEWRKPESTGDGWLDLVAAVFRQAIKDAQRGNDDARQWLRAVAPEWVERLGFERI